MKFRSALLLWIVLLIAAITVATAGSAAFVLERRAREELGEALERSARVFESHRTERLRAHATKAHVVAEEPRLKAVVATEDVSPETVYGVADELCKAVKSDLFLMTDGTGILLADVADPKASGFDMSKDPIVAGALREGERSGLWTNEGKLYEVVARRLSFGTETVGVLVLGFKLDHALAEEVRLQTGSLVAVTDGATVVAHSKLEDGRDASSEVLRMFTTPSAPEGGPYLSTSRTLDTGPGAKRTVHLARSLDRALVPSRELEVRVALIALVALAAAAALAIVLSRRLSRPLDGLMAFVGDVARGKLDTQATTSGPTEIRALGEAMNRMARELAESREQMAAKERLEKELEISARIQTSILPRRLDVPGLDVAARMIPASEVGGDYYDVFPVEGGGILAIGDVAGHGLQSGLVMLMVQSAIAALGREDPSARPKDLVRVLNLVLYDNIRNRLRNDEHVTLTVMRYHRSGRVVFAGAHEDILILRARTGKVEMIPTLGPWVGAMRDVARTVQDDELVLEDGDVMVLYTDGVTEARSASGEMYGMERLTQQIQALAGEPVERIRDVILDDVARFARVQEDDVTLVVVRFRASETSAEG
ncbi:PP2C family protein-serine/threonine phosphatase [Polyangium sorediatum]|uniref:SpoIIE family protein phosphatase n=1 Tax=Polyangium sorediatum TaxID=889274 RepID=A0ABT6NNK5_9BACT|nr:SpoIIE family protein phosphatase [Polyangium sorediatum]MDI1429908.1 SpoIIE family protein phosphatase [Polyangium sorediatum]